MIHIESKRSYYLWIPKTKLQEYSLKKFKKLPIYKLLDNSGPRHKPIFKVGVRLQNLQNGY